MSLMINCVLIVFIFALERSIVLSIGFLIYNDPFYNFFNFFTSIVSVLNSPFLSVLILVVA